MRKRAVIFGCGYVGASLVDELLGNQFDLYVLNRNSDKLRGLSQLNENHKICADLHSDVWHDRLIGDFDIVINTVSAASRGLEGYATSYLKGNQSILAWMQEREVGHFLYTSATSVYSQTEGQWVTESDVIANALSQNGEILLEAENLLSTSSVAQKTTVLRLAGIYGPGRHMFLSRLLKGETVFEGTGKQFLNLVHLVDIKRAILTAVTSGHDWNYECFNLADSKPSLKIEIITWLAQQLGVGDVQFDPQKQSSRSLRRQVAGQLPNRRIDSQKFRRFFNWMPVYPSYQEGFLPLL